MMPVALQGWQMLNGRFALRFGNFLFKKLYGFFGVFKVRFTKKKHFFIFSKYFFTFAKLFCEND